eukprot:gene8656-6083_t
MPTLDSGYTLQDFLQRLERSPPTHMSVHYHQNRPLFLHRDDVFQKTISSLSWDRGLALVAAAYHTQPVSVGVYRALLARMVLHNRSVAGAVRHVPWRAALGVYSEAMQTHGLKCPPPMAISALRLLAPHRKWEAAAAVVKLEQANGRLTKQMLVEAARVCACPAAWGTALQLLHHLHAQDPAFLSDAITALRPSGTDALTVENAAHSLLPETPMAPRHRHIAAVLADVTAAVPWEVALQTPLCQSYLTHLAASTALSTQEKARRLLCATAQLPWEHALRLLVDHTTPERPAELAAGASTPQLPPTAPAVVSEALQSAVAPESLVPEDYLLRLGQTPATLTGLLAAVLGRLPTPVDGLNFLRHVRALGRDRNAAGVSFAAGQPAVRVALLRRCADSPEGWRVAVPVLVQEAFRPTPAPLLSQIVAQLRAARQASAAVQLLQQHIVPSQSRLEPQSMTALMECVLAHNQGTAAAPRQTGLGRVDWLTALSVLLLQVPDSDSRVIRTGTGPSLGAPTSQPVPVRLAVEAGSFLGAIRVIGYARRVNRTELPFPAETTALLYCLQYRRPAEAQAILQTAETKHGAAAVAPLHRLVALWMTPIESTSSACGRRGGLSLALFCLPAQCSSRRSPAFSYLPPQFQLPFKAGVDEKAEKKQTTKEHLLASTLMMIELCNALPLSLQKIACSFVLNETLALISVTSVDEKWNHSLENVLRKSTIGIAVGVLPALLLARTLPTRVSLLVFPVGVGVGAAYREARYLFDKNVCFDNRYLVQLRMPVAAEPPANYFLLTAQQTDPFATPLLNIRVVKMLKNNDLGRVGRIHHLPIGGPEDLPPSRA